MSRKPDLKVNPGLQRRHSLSSNLLQTPRSAPTLARRKSVVEMEFAFAESSPEEMRQMLHDGEFSLETTDFSGMNPLLTAAKFCKSEMIDILLEEGSELMHRDRHKNTAMHIAMMDNHEDACIETLQVLFKHSKLPPHKESFDINAKNKKGLRPIDLAAFYAMPRAVQLCVDEGADNTDIDMKQLAKAKLNKDFFDAASEDDALVDEWIKAHPDHDVNTRNYHGQTAIMAAAKFDIVNSIMVLKDTYGCVYAAQDRNGDNCIHHAAKNESWKCFDYLVDNASIQGREALQLPPDDDTMDLCAKNKKGETVMDICIMKDSLKQALKLRPLGAETNVQTSADIDDLIVRMRKRELLEAASEGYTHIVKELHEEKGISIEIQNNYGRTALLLAGRLGWEHTSDYLLDRKADVTHKDQDGNGVLHLAAMHGNNDVLKLIARRCLSTKGREIFTEFKIDPVNNNGETPLMLATRAGISSVVAFLIGRGAKLDAKDKGGTSVQDEVNKHEKLKFAASRGQARRRRRRRGSYNPNPVNGHSSLEDSDELEDVSEHVSTDSESDSESSSSDEE